MRKTETDRFVGMHPGTRASSSTCFMVVDAQPSTCFMVADAQNLYGIVPPPALLKPSTYRICSRNSATRPPKSSVSIVLVWRVCTTGVPRS